MRWELFDGDGRKARILGVAFAVTRPPSVAAFDHIGKAKERSSCVRLEKNSATYMIVQRYNFSRCIIGITVVFHAIDSDKL
jgi:hypothetical protein